MNDSVEISTHPKDAHCRSPGPGVDAHCSSPGPGVGFLNPLSSIPGIPIFVLGRGKDIPEPVVVYPWYPNFRACARAPWVALSAMAGPRGWRSAPMAGEDAEELHLSALYIFKLCALVCALVYVAVSPKRYSRPEPHVPTSPAAEIHKRAAGRRSKDACSLPPRHEHCFAACGRGHT